ncbi:MAG: hypothetical protein EA397_02870 [Deltaproteobacteria bacterium]|nr:MAG: hypothetical protein EA397_02870 [Deltaproteobacteria bacterium]
MTGCAPQEAEPSARQAAPSPGIVRLLTQGVPVPECGLKVFNENGELARSLRVGLDDPIDHAGLELVRAECIQGVTCSYATLADAGGLRAIYLHSQLLPPSVKIFGVRRRVQGRWVTHRLPLSLRAGGRGFWGPECFFRQVDLTSECAWLAPLLLRLRPAIDSRAIGVGKEELWSWELDDQRYYYADRKGRWDLYGAGNTPLLRLEQALHLAEPDSPEAYLWAIGAVPVGRRSRPKRPT